MKIEIEFPNGLGEFLTAIAVFRKEDPVVFIKEFVQYYAVDSVRASMDTLGDNAFFLIEDLEKAYGLDIRIKPSESDVKRLKKEFVKRRSL